MNKQQLAAKIWESANKMRSKIEANEYKDYILGFIFYKFLSETEVARLRAEDWGDEDLKGLDENDAETVQYRSSPQACVRRHLRHVADWSIQARYR